MAVLFQIRKKKLLQKKLNGLMKKYQPEGGYEPIKPDMDVLKGVEVIKIVPESLTGKYKIGQNMDMKSRIDLAKTNIGKKFTQQQRKHWILWDSG